MECEFLSYGDFCGEYHRVFFNRRAHFLFPQSGQLSEVSLDHGILWRLYDLFNFFRGKLFFMAKRKLSRPSALCVIKHYSGFNCGLSGITGS